VIGLTPVALYPRKEPWSGHFGKEINVLPLPGNMPCTFGRSFSLQSSHYTDCEYISPFYAFVRLIPSNDENGDENRLQRDEKNQLQVKRFLY